MVVVEKDSQRIKTLVLIPDRSADWKANKRVIAVLGTVCLLVSLGFYLVLGIWMVLPFAGLEIAALFAGLYYAQWKLNYRHIIQIEEHIITLEKGVYKPSKRWTLQRDSVSLVVCPAKHEWEAKSLFLEDNKNPASDEIAIGEFLSKVDIQKVIDELQVAIKVINRNQPRS